MEYLLQEVKQDVRGGELELPVVKHTCVYTRQEDQMFENDVIFVWVPMRSLLPVWSPAGVEWGRYGEEVSLAGWVYDGSGDRHFHTYHGRLTPGSQEPDKTI